MRYPIDISRKVAAGVVTAAAIVGVVGFLESTRGRGATPNGHATPNGSTSHEPEAQSGTSETAVELSPTQLNAIKIERAGTYMFPVEDETVGNIDFDEDVSVQVFPAYQGTIIEMLVELGADVQKDQALYTIKSPDLIQAESTLIGAAALFELTNKELARASNLTGTNGLSQRELEQATSDQQTAEGALKAARDAVRVFGKTDAEVDQMIASRKIDPALVVRSPMSGKITSKNAQPGFLAQPGNQPAPDSVADVTLKWMLANVPESDIRSFHLAQPVQVKVMAYPGHEFKGKVSKIYETVDPSVHRLTVRSEVSDPNNQLRPGMLANFVIRVQNPVEAVSIPPHGVVREGDGTMTAWVTGDRHRFVQRVIKTGLRRDDRVQILDGLQRGELVVTDGAVFLSSMLQGS